MPEILESPAYKKDGLLIVGFGIRRTRPAATAAPTRPRWGTLLLSPLLAPGATDGAAYDPYSVLRSIEDLFALEPPRPAPAASQGAFLSPRPSRGQRRRLTFCHAFAP